MTMPPPPGRPVPPSDQDTIIPESRLDAARASGIPNVILDGQYRVERAIGEGAFGRVYLAQDTRIRRNVAIKELRASRNSADGDTYAHYLERFEREARAAGMIQHPNIVTVHELGLDEDGTYYLVMEYIDGTDLRALLAQVGTLDPERTVAIALDIARALVDVHEHDIIHRDLKPANIMITRRGTAKLTDFGVAQVSTESQRDDTASKHPGSPAYMSPEQAYSTGYIDGRSDLYALGLVMYEMLVGERFVKRRQPLTLARPDVPARLNTIVTRLLAHDPNARYQNAAALVHDLETFSAHADEVAAPPPTPPQKASRRGIVIGLAAAATIGVIAMVIGWRTFHTSSPASPVPPTLVPGRPTWFAPNGVLRLQYFQGWTTKTDTTDPTSLIEIDGPDGLVFYVNMTTPEPPETLAQAVARYRQAEANDQQLAFTDRAELDATVGGEPAKMVTVSVRPRYGDTAANVWEYWIVEHGGKEYRFLATDVGTHGTDVASMIASVGFLG